MTLIELVAVMVLMSLIVSMGVGAYFSWSRSAGLRRAHDQVLSGLHRARQLALTRRCEGRFIASNITESAGLERGILQIQGVTNRANPQSFTANPAQSLPRGIRFDDTFFENGDFQEIRFSPDGKLKDKDPGSLWTQVVVTESGKQPNPLSRTASVHRLTGFIRAGNGETR